MCEANLFSASKSSDGMLKVIYNINVGGDEGDDGGNGKAISDIVDKKDYREPTILA